MKINILGVNIIDNKNIMFGITKIYGIGLKKSIKIFNKLNIDKKKNFLQLSVLEKQKLLDFLKNIIVENNLKILVKENLKRVIDLNSFKSLRHKKKLPCRGQRTKTNAKTCKKMNHENI